MSPSVEEQLDALNRRVGTVRWWLIALAVLRVAALTLACVSLYIGVYVWIDHHIHMGPLGRVVSLSLLVALVLGVVFLLARCLLGHISCSRAATFIERRFSFDQRLVAVIEYRENRKDYCYSRVLAEHLVRQVDRSAGDVQFDEAVPKWQAVLLSLAILLGLTVAGMYMHANYRFFSQYLTRLVQPLAKIDPLPSTVLRPLTGDLAAEPQETVRPAAEIEGKAPKHLAIELASVRPIHATITQDVETDAKSIPVTVTDIEAGRKQLDKDLQLPEGKYRYRFKADDAVTDWRTITVASLPRLARLTAEISLPGSKLVKSYKQEIKDNTLTVFKGSHVKLNAQATDNLQGVLATGSDQRRISTTPPQDKTFQAEFEAAEEGDIQFQLTNAAGTTNAQVPPLRILIKENAPPSFKLLSPEGDYTATNVASVPITFEVSDDFGLHSADLFIELPGKNPIAVGAIRRAGDTKTTISTVVELENYDLELGDSVIFYASAGDLDLRTGANLESTATSEVYFIEIGPYRKTWFQAGNALPDQPKQGLKGAAHDALMAVLEYTRAFVKKTWTIARKSVLTEDDRVKLTSIRNDVQYAAEQLTFIRNDPRYGFDDVDKAKIDEILKYMDQAATRLSVPDAAGGLQAEKQAYLALRKFILDLARVLGTGGGGDQPGQAENTSAQAKPDKPDQSKMEDTPHLSRYEKERIEWELKKLADKLEAIRAEQESHKKDFDHFLSEQKSEKPIAQQASGEKNWTEKDKPYDQPQPEVKEKTPDTSKKQSDSQDKGPTVEGAQPRAKDPKKEQNEGKTQRKRDGKEASSQKDRQEQQQQSAAQGDSGEYHAATPQEQMELLQAKQKALQEETVRVRQALDQLPVVKPDKPDAGDPRMARIQAKDHLDQAMQSMGEFQKQLSDAGYMNRESRNATLGQASQRLEKAGEELAAAAEVLERQFEQSALDVVAKSAVKKAEELAKLAEAFDASVSPEDQKRMLASLEEAKRLLESIDASKVVEIQGPMEVNDSQQPKGGGVTKVNPYYTGSLPPRQRARFLALKFWSIAVQAKHRQGKLMEQESSNAEFHELEKRFFENAARYHREEHDR